MSVNRRTFLAAGMATSGLAALPAMAQLRIEITGVGANQLPIAIPQFQGTRDAPVDLAQVITADLERSGAFRAIRVMGEVPAEDVSAPRGAFWQKMGASALVVGQIVRASETRLEVEYRLVDTVKNAVIDQKRYVATPTDLRLTAHQIADAIYEKLTGEGGIFASRLAYVLQRGPHDYELVVADSDGENPQPALKSKESIISPMWSPNGLLLTYVSFEANKPVVYMHDVRTGERRAVANFKGNNSAPSFSPDGKTMAVALSMGGGTHIYLMNLNGTNLRRFTNSQGIDTEPVFSPDGRYVYFTSDRGGTPQIYRQPVTGGAAERVTYSNEYAISPAISPKGDKLAFISRLQGAFRVTLMDLTTGSQLILTDTTRDESPTFAPNGQILVYATELGGQGVLATVSLDGLVRTRLSGQNGDIREPTWGPLLK